MITKKILVVDDEETICQSVEKILSRRGYKVDKALNADSAIKKINESSYDLVITDLMMPKTSGMELLEIIRKHYPELEVVMITGYSSIDTAVKATKLGASNYLPKPFSPEELNLVTERALSRKKENNQKKELKNSNPSNDIIDVDMPFSEAEITKYTSKEYVETLTHSDIPHAKKTATRAYCHLGKRDCRKVVVEGKECVGDCPIEKKEKALASKSIKKVHQFSKDIIDVDMPFSFSEIEKFTCDDYLMCLDRSDMPRVGMYGKKFASKNNVLVIDDEPIVCQSIRKILSKRSYSVDEVFDVDAAIHKMRLNQYDLVLLDLKMPKRNGMEVLESIKRLYPKVPVIMITGYATIETAIEATKLGAFNFISKPFTPEELTKVTEEAIA